MESFLLGIIGSLIAAFLYDRFNKNGGQKGEED